MLILSHRGLWVADHEKNAPISFDRTLMYGFGTETDVRDHGEKLVISHDPPRGDEITLCDIIEKFKEKNLYLALNIKADGLSQKISQIMAASHIPWFAFDMSGPEMIRYIRAKLPIFTRHSDVERHPICYDEAEGVWLDAFYSDWFGPDNVRMHLSAGKKVCIVSPDLHGRDYGHVWEGLRTSGLASHPDVMLCTDSPDKGRAFFGS
ncbi:hypothetical protein AA13595_1985 [Gluconacetobacter johannae DSM 13595]|nr:hypothetical protein [Gluconacetobacter johannae]GBQ86794.1 hypothetical protein AA13595_1985 [Gluconacetobacter johannae DSM 13595]